MKVRYDRFFTKLKENHMTQKEFKEKSGVASNTMGKLINNESITVNTICRICDYFQCMPDEIMEWIPESDYDEKRKEREEMQKQIVELQEKLKKL